MKSVNGSLWTVALEIQCYILTIFCGLVWSCRFTILPITLTYIVFYHTTLLTPNSMDDLSVVNCFFFLLGSCFYAYPQWFRLHTPGAFVSLIAMAVLYILGLQHWILHALFISYLTLYFAIKCPQIFNIRKYGDYSYGFYIYTWPVQQAFAAYYQVEPSRFIEFFIMSFVVASSFAILSWHLVEKRALAFTRDEKRQEM